MSEVIETGFGDGQSPPEFKIEKEKRGFSFFVFRGWGAREARKIGGFCGMLGFAKLLQSVSG